MATPSSPSPTHSPTSSSSSYWCYQCDRFVRATAAPASPACPSCGGGFLEEMGAPPPPRPAYLRRHRAHNHHHHHHHHHHHIAAAAADLRPRRARRGASGSTDSRASPFNPVIVLRRSPPTTAADGSSSPTATAGGSTFELFYDDGAGSGLRPLPDSMSDFLMGSGFERLLDQLAQIEAGGLAAARARDAPPASKAAVESMPVVSVGASHVAADAHCAVCKEAFELGAEAREMPCAHIYHADCILPWLAIRNSCPVCRHEMPTDATPRAAANAGAAGEEEEATVGLTIWRLPGGGFAVGRFAGGRRPEERELPVVYTEMDGGFNSGGAGAPRRISWGSRQTASTDRGTVRRFLRNVFACFGGRGSAASRSHAMPELDDDDASDHSAAFSRGGSRSRSTSWRLEDGHAADAMVQR
ncbi:probable E3 ubiquitin-protein ligase RHC2A [Sorghum bicolor]|uniref:RING-type E3 ubiquitin transferase n=1 Tax=Sorghum bicolor TaxID=4558 RepID=C5YYG0_SORBI|nr:probable E3 ubiquitin-protein ligase RHC2A [Sorghum bicolor]EES17560.1 hypothetical protein SORBI_3009G010400 [Sorghum bicolor]|eukprot:XP_002439130.1 probable E3 ubiquitin-protein ligase RHC2A [Sorghum bicolor]